METPAKSTTTSSSATGAAAVGDGKLNRLNPKQKRMKQAASCCGFKNWSEAMICGNCATPIADAVVIPPKKCQCFDCAARNTSVPTKKEANARRHGNSCGCFLYSPDICQFCKRCEVCCHNKDPCDEALPMVLEELKHAYGCDDNDYDDVLVKVDNHFAWK